MKKVMIVAAFAALSVGAAPARKPAAAPAWTSVVSRAPNGAYVMGNPEAKIRFVEYLSFTCGHCSRFVAEANAPLKAGYVAKGLVSVEIRNAVRDQYDMTAALLSRCGGAGRVFGNTELLMATQGEWAGKINAFVAAQGEKLAKAPVNAQLQAIAAGTGMTAILAKRGLSPTQLNACLVDKTSQQQVLAMTKEAWEERKINGTPSFLVNGSPLENAGSWAQVEPALQAALNPS